MRGERKETLIFLEVEVGDELDVDLNATETHGAHHLPENEAVRGGNAEDQVAGPLAVLLPLAGGDEKKRHGLGGDIV